MVQAGAVAVALAFAVCAVVPAVGGVAVVVVDEWR